MNYFETCTANKIYRRSPKEWGQVTNKIHLFKGPKNLIWENISKHSIHVVYTPQKKNKLKEILTWINKSLNLSKFVLKIYIELRK